MGRCGFDKPAVVTMVDSITAEIYGHWLKTDHEGSLIGKANNDKGFWKLKG